MWGRNPPSKPNGEVVMKRPNLFFKLSADAPYYQVEETYSDELTKIVFSSENLATAHKVFASYKGCSPDKDLVVELVVKHAIERIECSAPKPELIKLEPPECSVTADMHSNTLWVGEGLNVVVCSQHRHFFILPQNNVWRLILEEDTYG